MGRSHMNKRIAIAAATFFGGLTLAMASPASAAHCVQNDSPGFSYYGQDGRSEDANDPGANECPANTGSPSDRAPGQNP